MSDTIKASLLDNAATSWPKPPAVLEAINRYYSEFGAAAHRGASSISMEVDRTVRQCRNELRDLLNARSQQVAFCFNGTDGLNQVLFGLINQGDHVVSSVLEHNSVLLTFAAHERSVSVSVDLIQSRDGIVDVDELGSKLTADTKVCCLSHASNVTGVVQPVAQVAEICRKLGVLLVVDAAQTVGHMPVDVQELNCDILCRSGP